MFEVVGAARPYCGLAASKRELAATLDDSLQPSETLFQERKRDLTSALASLLTTLGSLALRALALFASDLLTLLFRRHDTCAFLLV